MRSPASYVRVNGTLQLFASGAAPKTLSGASISTRNVALGSLSAKVAAVAKTSTTTITANWQVSDDGSTWVDAKAANNAANVLICTGTGSSVTTTVMLAAPDAVYGWNFCRVQAVTGTSTADGTDDGATFSYRYLKDRW